MSTASAKVIIINPYSHEGRGWKRWLGIRQEVLQRLADPVEEIVLERGACMEEVLQVPTNPTAHACIISAGGDGSLHYLVNYLMSLNPAQRESVVLGAIGLGSSNDFLKPFGENIRGIPVRINQRCGTLRHDVGLACYRTATNQEQKKYFIVNASFGVTAQANWNFNNPDMLLVFLKKYLTPAAIGYTAISTILKHRNTSATMYFDEQVLETALSNVNILKNPYVSGSFHYKQQLSRDDGKLSFNACLNMNPRELLSVLSKLQQGSFPASAKTISAFIKDFRMTANKPFVFECDGETDKTDSISIAVIPRALNVLKN